MDVLVIGRNVEILETVKGGLIAKGIAADGTTDAERASIDFDARDFAVVAFGGVVGSPLRETLKGDFRRQNPDVILLVEARSAQGQASQWEYALARMHVGALALFALVSALMAMTQRVNWSAQPSVSFN